MQQYLELYEASANAVREVDPQAKVGGGTCAGWSEEWTVALLNDVAEKRLPFDFLSYHDYGTPTKELVKQMWHAQELFKAFGLKAEIILDEWNYDPDLNPANDDHRGAVYYAEHLRGFIDAPLDYAPFFEIKDGEHYGDSYWGRWGVVNTYNTPKAVYYCSEAFQQLGPERYPLASDDPDVDGFATIKNGKVVFLLYNKSKVLKEVEVAVAGLPAATASDQWRLWRIDADHSNPARGTLPQLQLSEEEWPVNGRQGPALRRKVLLTPTCVTLCEYNWAYTLPQELKCEFQPAIAELPGYRSWLLTIANVSSATIAGASIRVWTDDNSAVTVLPINKQYGRPWSAAATLGPGEKTELQILLAEPATVEPIVTGLFAELALPNNRLLRQSLAVLIEPTLRLSFDPPRIPWAQPGNTISFNLVIDGSGVQPINGRLEWKLDACAQLLPSFPETFGFMPGSVLAQTLPATVVPLCDHPPYAFSLGVSTCLPGALPALRNISLEVPVQPSFKLAHAPVNAKLDGKLGEWTAGQPLGEIASPTTTDRCRFWMGWTDQGLELACEVHDASHIQAVTPEDMWHCDSLQLAFDPLWNTTVKTGYDQDDVEIGFAWTDQNPLSWRWKLCGSELSGPATQEQIAVIRSGEVITYEVQIPWTALGRPTANQPESFGFTLVWNDADGPDVRQGLEWGGGVSLRKEPWRFFHLRPE